MPNQLESMRAESCRKVGVQDRGMFEEGFVAGSRAVAEFCGYGETSKLSPVDNEDWLHGHDAAWEWYEGLYTEGVDLALRLGLLPENLEEI